MAGVYEQQRKVLESGPWGWTTVCDPTHACGSEKYFNLFRHYCSLLLILCSFVMKKMTFSQFSLTKVLKTAFTWSLKPCSHCKLDYQRTSCDLVFTKLESYGNHNICYLLLILFLTTLQINIAASQACCSCWQIICGRMEGGRDNWKSTLTLSHQSEGWRDDQSHWLTWIPPEPIPSSSMRATWEHFTLQQSVIRDQCCTEPSLTDCIRYCTSEV